VIAGVEQCELRLQSGSSQTLPSRSGKFHCVENHTIMTVEMMRRNDRVEKDNIKDTPPGRSTGLSVVDKSQTYGRRTTRSLSNRLEVASSAVQTDKRVTFSLDAPKPLNSILKKPRAIIHGWLLSGDA